MMMIIVMIIMIIHSGMYAAGTVLLSGEVLERKVRCCESCQLVPACPSGKRRPDRKQSVEK